MKKIKYIIGAFSALIMFLGCEQGIELNSGITDPTVDPTKKPTNVVTGDVVTNLGNSATFNVTVGGDNGSGILDVGVILIKGNVTDFGVETQGVIFSTGNAKQIGASEITASALSIGTLYSYRAYSTNVNGITYGEVKTFSTLAVYYTPYKTNFSEAPGMRDYWVLDNYTGYDESGQDPVWYFDPSAAGAPASWGQSVAVYNSGAPGETYKISSPKVMIAENDTLSFSFYVGLFGGPKPAKIKVYVTENLENLGTPVKDWSLSSGGRTKIPMAAYLNKSIHVVWVVEQGDVFFYLFAIANTTDSSKLFQ
ncbi:MAG: hypothetical protein PHS40_12225 [Mariniphaga sp.]|nr:hypothetical protein [Mariniphaga sp.]